MVTPRVPHILVVDDDPKIRSGIEKFLEAQNYRVHGAEDGAAMRAVLARRSVDLILLDVMLPRENGLTLLKELRSRRTVPVVLLTAMDAESDRVLGLELGAEDYICKPFGLRELLARIRVVLRRGPTPVLAQPHLFSFDGWTLDVRSRTLVSPRQEHVELTTGEFEMLCAFTENPSRVMSRDLLLDLSRGRSSLSIDRAVDVQVMRLRRKIELDPAEPRLIKTVRNGGYVFTPQVTRSAAGHRES